MSRQYLVQLITQAIINATQDPNVCDPQDLASFIVKFIETQNEGV